MIPAVAHLVWFGKQLSWLHVLAVRSAALHGDFDEVIFHHGDDLSGSPWWEHLRETDRVTCQPLRARELLRGLEHPRAEELESLFQCLEQPAAKANVIRAALLFQSGGVYLDTDTVTLRSFEPIFSSNRVTCGEESIAFPGSLRWYHPRRYALAYARTALRDGFRRMPDGWRWFRHVEGLYPRGANNAVLASPPNAPFMGAMLHRMADMPHRRRHVRYALGTALLQSMVERHRDDLWVLPPGAFYPLGPEISEHWFRPTPHPRPHAALFRDTYVIHWYASVRTRHIVEQACPEWIRSHAKTQMFSALVEPMLGSLGHS